MASGMFLRPRSRRVKEGAKPRTAQVLKSLGRQRFCEEISVVVVRVNQRNDDLLRLDHVPNEEVPASNMFRSTMMFWII